MLNSSSLSIDPLDITAPDPDTHIHNPMLGKLAWFQPYDPSAPPIHIAEAACTAFATRLRQVLSKDAKTSHITRTQYTSEAILMKLRDPALQWPSLVQARLLIQVVFSQLSRVYHLVLRKSTMDELEDAYRKGDFSNPILNCKFFALFALGEVYSVRSNSNPECGVPGASFYANAMMLIPILPERPSLAHIESLLLLSLYSYFLNRRHSAFLLIGSAMRLGLTLGLHHNIPECQCPDPIDRQHRIRLWWTIYVYDRIYSSKAGWPNQLSDGDINVEMPSTVPGDAHDEQFSDTEFLIASIELAGITGQVTEKVYSRKKQPDSFLQREQKLLMALKQWSQALPPHIRLIRESRDGPLPKNVISLHLQFNQCIILATRPILLYTLIQSKDASHDKCSAPSNAQTLKTLSDACIHAARNTHSLIVDEWASGSLPIFGYFYAHYIFSCALIMVISSQIYSDQCNDFALFETAFEILHAMSDHGNLAASEFYENLQCVRECLDKEESSRHSLPLVDPTDSLPDPAARGSHGLSGHHALPEITVPGNLTDEMEFLGASMEEFLAQPDVDFGPLDPSGVPINVADAMYSWPTFSLWTA
ncbi:hypothetical protein N7466_005341 [Penicillium verhagenii]|uniref:uncharacterized protein n=1 Tax=Penicillium verhagenii TaxID=1562060 RepID=UPI002545A43F|nr:uncharacterized protein N7466_005341 [Penicillium verhagenii]KAJ5935794.1 hypothetical protein N7466_005341 [Penicillium verhagenii]